MTKLALLLISLIGLIVPAVIIVDSASATTLSGVTASPNAVQPGDLVTVSGPAVAACAYGNVILTRGGEEFRFGRTKDMRAAWTVSDSRITFRGVPTAFILGEFSVKVECFDARESRTLYDTSASLTVVPDQRSYRPVKGARLLDTRVGQTTVDGLHAGGGAVGPGSTTYVKVAGRAELPGTGLKAVVLNVTSVGPSSAGYFTVYASGTTRPPVASVNFGAGLTTSTAVVTKVGSDGQVAIFSGVGTTHLIVDVSGYFPVDAPITPLSPARLYDTRSGATTVDGIGAGTGALPQNTIRTVQVAGRAGVPTSGVGSVILTVTSTQSSSAGFFTVYPSGSARPLASTLNWSAGQPISNVTVSPLGADGNVKVYNDAGSTHLIVDVVGWFPAAASTSRYTALSVPARLMDTRPGAKTVDGVNAGCCAVPPSDSRVLSVLGRAGLPSASSEIGAVVLNVTAAGSSAAGHLSLRPREDPPSTTSTVNFAAGQVVANLAVVKVGRTGEIFVRNGGSAEAHVIIDIVGWFAPVPASL